MYDNDLLLTSGSGHELSHVVAVNRRSNWRGQANVPKAFNQVELERSQFGSLGSLGLVKDLAPFIQALSSGGGGLEIIKKGIHLCVDFQWLGERGMDGRIKHFVGVHG